MQEHEKIKKIRTKLNLTQQEMADALGVSKQYFSKVENGHTQLSKEKISIFSDKYGVSLDWLVNNKGQMFYQDEENIEFANNVDNFIPLVNHISLYNSYIIGITKFIKQKYPNALIEDILFSAGKFFMEDVINKRLIFSDKKEIENNLAEKISTDEQLSQNILNLYFKAYVDRMEHSNKNID